MRKNLITLVLCILHTYSVSANILSVENLEAGTLATLLSNKDLDSYEDISISGEMNGDDFDCLRDLNLKHNLIGIWDLANVKIVKGGNSSYGYSTKKGTNEDELKLSIFYKINRIRKFIAPTSLTEIYNDRQSLGGTITHDYWINADSIICECPNVERISQIGDATYLYLGEGIKKLSLDTEEYYYNSPRYLPYPQTIELHLPSTLRELSAVSSSSAGNFPTPTVYSEITRVDLLNNYSALERYFEDGTIYVPEGTKALYENSMFRKANIIENIKVKGINFEESQIVGYIGEKYSIKPKFNPENALNKNLLWQSSNIDIASLDENEYILAKSFGHSIITAISEDGNFSDSFEFKVFDHVTNIKMDEKLSLNIGEFKNIDPTIFPLETADNRVVWTSSNPGIATVDESGNVKGINQGKCIITATSVDGGHTAQCEVTVIQPVESLSVTPKSLTLKATETSSLSVNVLPANADDKTVFWKSEDENIARVDNNGKVTAIAGGQTKIYAISNFNNEIKDYCDVSVIQPVTGIYLNENEIEISEEGSVKLVATVVPENASNKKVSWTSTDPTIALVSGEGVVYGMKQGNVTIIAATEDGGFMAMCKVKVVPGFIPVTNITLDNYSIQGEVNDVVKLSAIVMPENASNKVLLWQSSDTSVASVDNNGLVRLLKEGTCIITASATDNSGIKAECKINVSQEPDPTVSVTGIVLSETNVELIEGQTIQLLATVQPNDATNKKIIWSSSNPEIASVNDYGLVSSLKEGNATITAITEEGGFTATCLVTVIRNNVLITSISFDKYIIDGKENDEIQIQVTILPENATNKKLNWISSDDSVVEVSDAGLLYLKKEGTSMVSANTTDSSDLKTDCVVVVRKRDSGLSAINIDADEYVSIFNLTGTMIYSGKLHDVNLPSGVYIVWYKGESYKIFIK